MSLKDKKSTKTINESSENYTGNSKLINLGKNVNNLTTPTLSDKTRPSLDNMLKTPEKPKGDVVNDMLKTPEKPKGDVKNDMIKTPDKKTPIVNQPNSQLINFPLPEIKKRNLNQSVHLQNGQMYAGYSKLDLVGDAKSDFNKGNTEFISLFSEAENFPINTAEKTTANLEKRPLKEMPEKKNNLTPNSVAGKNNLTSNTINNKSVLGKNNLISDTVTQRPVIGQNNLSSNFNKPNTSIGNNNLSSDFNKPKVNLGQNNLTSDFNKPRTIIGKNNLGSNIDTSVKYKP